MRLLFFLLLLLIQQTGCSAYMAHSGTPLNGLRTREAVHQAFGEPIKKDEMEGPDNPTGEASYVEEFHTRRKLSEPLLASHCAMPVGFTFGLLEIYYFPRECLRIGGDLLFGQTVRATYDESGQIREIDSHRPYYIIRVVAHLLKSRSGPLKWLGLQAA